MRKQITFLRLGAVACILLALSWIGWRIIAETAAQNVALFDPATALGWVSDEPAALDQLAQEALTDPKGDLDAARNWAQRALRSNPLDTRALWALGLIAERKGDSRRADALMQISGARTWREPTSQLWLFNRDIRHGEYANALPHMDAILRVDTKFRAQFFPTLAAFAVNSNALNALVEFLATSPPWRSWFLTELSARLANRSRLVQLYSMLNKTENPVTTEELLPYLNRLIRDGSFSQAYQTWRDALPPSERTNVTYPYNRDYEAPVDGSPFNWVIEAVQGADVQIVPSPDGGKKRALRIQFAGGRVGFANVRQLLLLPPGKYSLAGRVKTEDLRSSRGLWWRIFCADASGSTIAHTELVHDSVFWTDFMVDFDVPTQSCNAQWLQLELPARVDSEKQIGGQIWYENLRIGPLIGAGTPQGPARPSRE